MKSRQDKTGEGKFYFQLPRQLAWFGGNGTPGTEGLISGAILGVTVLCASVISAAPVVAARAPYLDSPAAQKFVSPPPVFAAQPGLVAGPTIERIETHVSGAIRLVGRGTPHSIISIEIDGRIASSPAVDATGRWQTEAEAKASKLAFVITTAARGAGTPWPVPGQSARVAIPQASVTARDAALNQVSQSRIYEYARIGLLANAPQTIVTRVRVAAEVWSWSNVAKPFLMAQAAPAPDALAAAEAPAQPAAGQPSAAPPQPAADAVVAPVKRESPKTPPATEPAVVPAAAPADPADEAPAAKPAAAPEQKTPPSSQQAAPQQAAPQQSATKSPPPPPDVGGVVSRVQDWLARANREYQGTIVKELSRPSTGGADADAIAAAKKRELEKAADATKAAEAKRLEDEKRRSEQAKSEAGLSEAAKAEAAKAVDAKKKADELKKAAEKKAADAAKKAEAAKPAEPAKPVEDEKAADDAKKAEAAKQAEAAKKAEEDKLAEEAAKAAATEKAAAAKDIEAEKLRAANEAARLTEQKRADQLRELEAKRKSVEEAQRKSDEAQRRADEAKRQSAEKAAAEAKAAEAARAKTAPRAIEPRAAETAVDTSKHRRLTITINPEPISRPRTEPTVGRPEVTQPAPEFKDQTLVADRSGVEDGVYVGGSRLRQRVRVYREATYRDTGRYARGPAVKRWVWRAKYGACRAAGRKMFAPRRYVVARGDSLWRISSRHYKAGRHYGRIYRANRSRISDPDLIYPCQRFLVPRR